MNSEWDRLQNLMKMKMEADFSETAVEHIMHPKNLGSLPDADATASLTSAGGDNMEIWLKVKEGKIEDISFRSWGCGVTIACGSLATELARGMSLNDALAISPEVILEKIGKLPEGHFHSAETVCLVLKKVINEYLNHPVKK